MGTLTKADDPDDALSAARARLTDASQATRDREADVSAGEAAEQVARDAAEAFAKLPLAPGAKHDAAELRAHASEIAIAAHTKAILQTALDEAVVAEQAAGVEVLKARWQVALRDAERLLPAVSAAYHTVADAGDTFVRAVKEGIAATEARMNAAAVAEGLRLELMGAPDTRPYVFPSDLEIRRFMSCLPVEWLREAGNLGFPVGDVDFHELAERAVARAKA